MIDADSFNFDAMREETGSDPFAEQANNYGSDDRFYTLAKNKDGSGAALIRFLPDSEKGMIQKLFSINTTITKNGKKRFVSEYSPSSIGQPDPFQERWQSLWNAGVKENVLDSNGNVVQYGSKTFGRGVRYITNIKILKDPANPENEGKIFLYSMSGKMKDKIQAALDPSEQDRALGAQPKELFNPLRGNSFRLVAKKGANEQINYDNSEVINDVTSIYDSVEEALEDIKANTYKLSDLVKPEAFLSYDELKRKLEWVTFSEGQANDSVVVQEPKVQEPTKAEPEVNPVEASTEAEVKTEPKAQEPAKTESKDDSLDALLEGLV